MLIFIKYFLGDGKKIRSMGQLAFIELYTSICKPQANLCYS